MSKDVFHINVEGYWTNTNKVGIPKVSGLFFVFECTFNAYNKSVTLKRLIYIGQSENLNKRILNHPMINEWISQLESGNEICYAIAEAKEFRERMKAALVHNSKPICNTKYEGEFPSGSFAVKVGGDSNFIESIL